MMANTFSVGQLVMRIQGAFLGSPALHLTVSEAKARFGVEPAACKAVLDALVDAHVLARSTDGVYTRFFPRMAYAA